MVRTYDTGDMEIQLSDRLNDIIHEMNGGVHGGYRVIRELEDAAEKYPNSGVIDFLGSDPASRQVTEAVLDTTWGIQFLMEARGTALQMALDTAINNPHAIRFLVDKSGKQVAKQLFKVSEEYPNEIQACIDATNSAV